MNVPTVRKASAWTSFNTRRPKFERQIHRKLISMQSFVISALRGGMISLNTEVLSSGPDRSSLIVGCVSSESLKGIFKMWRCELLHCSGVHQRAHGYLQDKPHLLATWVREINVTWWESWVRMCTLAFYSLREWGPSVEVSCQPNIRQPQAALKF